EWQRAERLRLAEKRYDVIGPAAGVGEPTSVVRVRLIEPDLSDVLQAKAERRQDRRRQRGQHTPLRLSAGAVPSGQAVPEHQHRLIAIPLAADESLRSLVRNDRVSKPPHVILGDYARLPRTSDVEPFAKAPIHRPQTPNVVPS